MWLKLGVNTSERKSETHSLKFFCWYMCNSMTVQHGFSMLFSDFLNVDLDFLNVDLDQHRWGFRPHKILGRF